MSVEELVKDLRTGPVQVGDHNSDDGLIELFDIEGAADTMAEAADKLEELAAEVTLTATQRDKWIEAAMVQQRKRGKAEAALAEKDKEIAALREALEPFALEYEARARLAPGPDIDHWPIGGSALTYKHIRIAYEASRNAGGKDAE